MIKIDEKVKLAPFTSWLVGGPADYFALPKTIEDIIELQSWSQKKNIPQSILGGGSNVLISDQGIEGLVLCLKHFAGVKVNESSEQLEMEALSGTSKSELLKIFLKYKLPPALFLAGLPGDIGGGVVMNAGVAENFLPREFAEITQWIEVLRPDSQVERIDAKSLRWSYRHCQGWMPGIIVRVGIKWPMERDEGILDKVKQANKVRLSKQPLDMPSCGSVFINPPHHKAAQLIDSCGLKGFTKGGAQVSMKHANFIVNLGNATALDIWEIITYVQKVVKDRTGVDLKTEVIRMGRDE